MIDDAFAEVVRRATSDAQMNVPVDEIVRRGTRRRSTRRASSALATVAALVAVTVAVQTVVLRPPPALAGGFVFADGTVIDIYDYVRDETTWAELRARLRDHDIDLRIDPRPVEPEADGRVFSVAYPVSGRVDREGRLIIDEDLRGTVVAVEIGRADPSASAGAGLSIFESIPELCAAVDAHDPVGTAEALRDRGFRVRWMLIDFSPEAGSSTTQATELDQPQAGTAIISVLDRHGRLHDVAPDERNLLIELVNVRDGGHEPLDACS